MPLPGANFVKYHAFVMSTRFSELKNDRIWMVLSLGSMLEVLVLKKYAECTSRRLKRTSGARLMIFVFNEIELSLTDV